MCFGDAALRTADSLASIHTARVGRAQVALAASAANTVQVGCEEIGCRRCHALLVEIASREAKFAAAEAYFEKYGVPPLDAEAIERIEAEWRGETSKKRRRRAA